MEPTSTKTPFFKKIWHWIKTHRPQTLAIAGVVLILAASGVAYAILSQPLPKQPVITVSKPNPSLNTILRSQVLK